MKWIEFPDGSVYTFAADIQKYAESHGYTVPCEADGTRHPGTDCNAKMRTIFKDAGMRRTFKLTEQSVVDVRIEDSFINSVFQEWLVGAEIVSRAYLKHNVIQLYSREAVNALLSVMLGAGVEYEPDESDVVYCSPYLVIKRSHNLEKRKNKPIVSLFRH